MSLENKTIAVLAEDLYEDLELQYPLIRLREAGATTLVVGPEKKQYVGKHGYPVEADRAVGDVDAPELDAVVVPGGYAPDKMRRCKGMVELVKDVYSGGGIVAMICHGGWVPISAGVVKGRRATSFFAIRDDMENAGARWVDEEVVVDGRLISSRNPDDLPAFCTAIIRELCKV